MLEIFKDWTTTIARYAMILTGWLLVVPIATSFILHFLLQRNIDTSHIFSHLTYGTVVFGIIILGTFMVMFIVDFLKSLKILEAVNMELNGPNPNNQEVEEVEILGFGDALFGLLDVQEEENDNPPQQEEENDFEFDRLVGLRGSFISLSWHIFLVILINGTFMFIFLSIPSLTGKTAKKLVGEEITKRVEDFGVKEDFSTTFVGYVIDIVLVYLYINFLTFKNKIWGLSSVEKHIASMFMFVYTCAKVVVLAVLEMLMFPVFTGTVVDYYTMDLFGAVWEERMGIWRKNPTMFVMVHWVLGFVFMFIFTNFVRYVRSISRTGLLWFLRDPDSPDFSPVRDMIKEPLHFHRRRILASGLLYAALAILVLYWPTQVAKYLFPSLFPLTLITDPLYEATTDILVLHLFFPFLIEVFNPKRVVTLFLRKWLYYVGGALDLKEYIFGKPLNPAPRLNLPEQIPEAQDNPPAAQDNPPAAPQDILPEAEDPDLNYHKPPFFKLRILILLLAACATSMVISVMGITVPVIVGRPFVYNFVAADLYSYLIGMYILWALVRGTAAIYNSLLPFCTRQGVDKELLLEKVVTIVKIAGKLVFVGLLWLVILPIMVGIWINLCVLSPLRAHSHQTLSSNPYHMYVLGLLYMKLWQRIITSEGISEEWQKRFKKAHTDGIARMDLHHILFNIILPIANFLLLRLCIPYSFSKLIVPQLGLKEWEADEMNQRVYTNFSSLLAFGEGFVMVVKYLGELHTKIRDDKYLIGQELQNTSLQENSTPQ
eukprot:TRINITY_DN2406_c0_g1_i1.p1 TRINITY_DN2406_c0_g1~~TRINITY_DN2406_c0_g1_i1.p1  ORF type:complete len:866 (-),score=151.96 TRINITY_DN2406_c0_g1_i1:29-2341(-)